MGCLRICDQNYFEESLFASISVSSENASFPASNLYDQRRKRVWRTAGYYEVKTGQNSIVFRETIGVDLTASVTVGSYTSIASFLAAIKTALDAAGASTYTVSQDVTTKKFKIVSNGAGGGGIFDLRWAASSADMADLMGFDTVNLTGALTYTADILSIHEYEFIKIDLGVPSLPTDCIVAGHRNQPLKLSPGAVVTLQGNSTDNWTSPEYSQTVTLGEHSGGLFNADGLHTSALRYWRIVLEDRTNPLCYSELSLLFLGRSFSPTRGAAAFPLDEQQVDPSETVFSEGGQSFSEEREQTTEINLEWRGLTKDDKDEMQDIFERFGTHTPLWLNYDTEAALSLDNSRWLRWAKFRSAPRFALVSPGNWAATTSHREEL